MRKSFKQLFILCSVGISVLRSATYTYRLCRFQGNLGMPGPFGQHGKRDFDEADGSVEAGCRKSF